MSTTLSQSSVATNSAGSETSNVRTETKFLSLRSAAIQILSSTDFQASEAAKTGLSPKEIYSIAVERKLISNDREGKTPAATLAAAFYTDINKNKAGGATFRLVTKGHFGLTEAALSGTLTPHAAGSSTKKPAEKSIKSENPAEKLAGKFPAPTTDMRGRSLKPNTAAGASRSA